MDETRAREIASWWHSGQWSPLYAFCSTGTRKDGLATEVRQCLAEVKAHIGHYTDEDIRNLRGLMDYLATNGEDD